MKRKQPARESVLTEEPAHILSENNTSGMIGRRSFLKGAAATAGCFLTWSLIGRPDKAFAEDFNGQSDHFGMLTDITRCIGCRRCESACNKVNNLPPPEIPFDDKSVFEHKRRTDDKSFTVVNRYADPRTGDPAYRKIQCNHCAEPACASACLVGALKKSKEGPVTYNESVCIGCRYCMTACPFYIPAFEYFDATAPAIQKCSMCYDRIINGEVPACATECPMEAIAIGKRSELIKLARYRISSEPGKYVDHIYGEHEVGGTDWLYISGIPFEDLDFPSDLGTTPYPQLTRDFLSAVPLVLVVWPALFGGIYLFSKRRDELAAGSEATNQDEKDSD